MLSVQKADLKYFFCLGKEKVFTLYWENFGYYGSGAVNQAQSTSIHWLRV